jgi:hypothetical protein
MWYCDPHGDIQHMEPREILKHGKSMDFTQCRLRHGSEEQSAKVVKKENRQVFD